LISNKQLGITDTRSGATPASVRPWGAVGLCGREGKNGGREGKTDFFSEAGVHDTRRDRPASVAGVASPAPFNRHLAAPNLYYLEILVMLRWELNSMSSLRAVRYRKLALASRVRADADLLLKLADECDRGILCSTEWLARPYADARFECARPMTHLRPII